jgi:DNA-binding transcriptional regulator YiaG
MCEATTLMLISSAVSAYGQYQQSQAQADAIEAQAAVDRRNVEIKNQQLAEDAAVERIRAHDEEQVRRKRLNESLAGMNAMNRGRDSESFTALTTADVDAYKFDINQIRLGAGIAQSRIASQIQVNKNSVANAGYGADSIRKGGMFSAAGTLVSAGATYQQAKVPTTKAIM